MADGGSDRRVVGVLFFGGAKDAFGREGVELPWRPGMALADIWDDLVLAHPGLAGLGGHVRLARNGEFASLGEAVSAGDEVAVIPPVSGG
jgi:molybdopterin synthase catalytic subunit